MTKHTTRRKVSADEIKAVARQQMADNGTAGISLRGIGRELGVTAPAIYNYFSSMDDLITALVIDAFNGLGDAVDKAVAEYAPQPIAQLRAGMWAYRAWALQHPADFQLIYGNPIPGYVAPKDVTTPLAIRPLVAFYTQLLLIWQDGNLNLPSVYDEVPESIADFIETWLYDDFPQLREYPKSLFLVMNAGWARIHGVVMLELFKHIGPSVGDVDAFYELEIDALFQQLGIKEDQDTRSTTKL